MCRYDHPNNTALSDHICTGTIFFGPHFVNLGKIVPRQLVDSTVLLFFSRSFNSPKDTAGVMMVWGDEG